ncbi:MAG: nucleoside hydrolase [Anaerolineales bacterium]|uniref:nucleoside hydrolase n=1 Tax=Candidatus Villigracilis vicinus TaxID=3140679 RepID=UPI003134AC68|nr:nucleoside hydrolase [Anaerolineales bacterium]
MPKHIIIDTDPGIDDSLALLLAAASPEISLDGVIAVHGNVSTEQTTKNALSVLELAGLSQVPVFKGCDLPLVKSHYSPGTHGGNGLGYAQLPGISDPATVKHGSDFLVSRSCRIR